MLLKTALIFMALPPLYVAVGVPVQRVSHCGSRRNPGANPKESKADSGAALDGTQQYQSQERGAGL